jgi:hypothetical protein
MAHRAGRRRDEGGFSPPSRRADCGFNAKPQRREVAKSQTLFNPCSAISESCAFLAQFFRLCFLCLLLFKSFGCGLPRCALATLRLCVRLFLPNPIKLDQGESRHKKESLTISDGKKKPQRKTMAANTLPNQP